jgi:hypothetical protein
MFLWALSVRLLALAQVTLPCVCGGYRDVGCAEIAAQGVCTDAATCLRIAPSGDGEISGVDEPVAGLAIGCSGVDFEGIGDLDVGG